MIAYERLSRRGQIRRMRRAAERALSLFGIEPASLTLLAHAFNTTFVVVGPNGGRYVLHLLLSMEDERPEAQRRARVESELWWLERVRMDLDLAAPLPVRTLRGEGVVSVAVEGMAHPLECTLFRWVDGRRPGRLTPAHLEAVGRVTARLHDHSTRLQVPTWFDRPRVDESDGAIEEAIARRFMDHYSAEAAGVMRRVFRLVRHTQEALGSGPETFGVIHADIHQWNYLFHRGEMRLIDFGDCGWGHYLYDFGVTLNELGALPHGAELHAALLAGYRRERTLSPAHEASIDAFVMLRQVQDLSWFLRERDNPAYARWTAAIGERLSRLERLLGER